jgi:hypothetical protein
MRFQTPGRLRGKLTGSEGDGNETAGSSGDSGMVISEGAIGAAAAPDIDAGRTARADISTGTKAAWAGAERARPARIRVKVDRFMAFT